MTNEEITNALIDLGEWKAQTTETLEGLLEAVRKLSSQDPATPDPFIEVFPIGPPKPEPVPVPTLPTATQVLETVWAMGVGESMPFLDGKIEMIRKPGTLDPDDPGEIQIHHGNINGGFQRLSIRASWTELASPLPETNIWMVQQTGNPDWMKNYIYNWSAINTHKQTYGYSRYVGIRPKDGYTCQQTKLAGRVSGAPTTQQLRDKWLK